MSDGAPSVGRAAAPPMRLYAPREPIYPKLVHGRFRLLKWAMMAVMLAIYYGVPWLRWDRPGAAPDQAVLVDFDGGRFYFFFLHLWPQEFPFVTGLLVMAALGLFLSNALFGRLWCGYACPQTVWTDIFIYVERLFEGDRNARMRLDAEPWSLNKLWRKAGKHVAWLLVAAATGGAWIFYFHDAPTLWASFWKGLAPWSAYVSFAVLTICTYLLAGQMREQVCIYMCPWPRIQAAMVDSDSMQVTYRRDRGEPRGSHKKEATWDGRGDCIDCTQCVVACPMGVDIREGAQIGCINCALCIDACDEIMVKVGRPTGLIAYDTDAAIAAREAGVKPSYRLVRPRTLFYGAALAVTAGLMTLGLSSRPDMDLHVARDRNPVYVRLHDGGVRDGYTLRIDNRTFETRAYRLSYSGIGGALVQTPGATPAPVANVVVEPDQTRAIRVQVYAPPKSGRAGLTPTAFVIETDGVKHSVATVFAAPEPAP